MRTAPLAAGALAALAAGLAAAPAGAAGPVTWRVVEATHTSTASIATTDRNGSSTMTWRLTRPTSVAPNRVVVGGTPRSPSGYGVVSVRGAVRSTARTERGACSVDAATGSREFGADVPGRTMTINVSAARSGGVEVALSARYASLLSAYSESECELRPDHQPSQRVTHVTRLGAAALRGRRIVLRFRGEAGQDGEAYRWSTRIVLAR